MELLHESPFTNAQDDKRELFRWTKLFALFFLFIPNDNINNNANSYKYPYVHFIHKLKIIHPIICNNLLVPN